MPCAICDHPFRDKIDEALDDRDNANPNGEVPSLEALCVQLQKKYTDKSLFPDTYPFTLPDILTHATKCPRYVESLVPMPSEGSVITEVEVGGETIVVPSWDLLKAYIRAAGLLNIIKHPDSVKPQHLIRLQELEGGKGNLDILFDAVRDLLSHHPPDAKGPMAPPRD